MPPRIRTASRPRRASTAAGSATDAELSPHLLADKIGGRIYIGAADKDNPYPPEMAARLCEALMEASIDHRHDLSVATAHGWTMRDFPVYDEADAERHWDELIGLFDSCLR